MRDDEQPPWEDVKDLRGGEMVVVRGRVYVKAPRGWWPLICIDEDYHVGDLDSKYGWDWNGGRGKPEPPSWGDWFKWDYVYSEWEWLWPGRPNIDVIELLDHIVELRELAGRMDGDLEQVSEALLELELPKDALLKFPENLWDEGDEDGG